MTLQLVPMRWIDLSLSDGECCGKKVALGSKTQILCDMVARYLSADEAAHGLILDIAYINKGAYSAAQAMKAGLNSALVELGQLFDPQRYSQVHSGHLGIRGEMEALIAHLSEISYRHDLIEVMMLGSKTYLMQAEHCFNTLLSPKCYPNIQFRRRTVPAL